MRQREGVHMTVTTRDRFKVLENLPKIEGVRFKHLEDKKVVVYENGRIFRVLENGYDEPNQHRLVPRGRMSVRYRIVTVNVTEDGKRKQKRYYVHRLVGEAFIPNPENKPQINHIDGNGENNHVSDLEWVTAKENTAHAFKLGLINTLENTQHKCIKCKGTAMNSGSLCAECKSEMRALKGRLLSKQNQRNKFRDIDTTTLKPRYRNIIKSRFRGDTLQEIGDRMGVTREYIRQLEERVLNKDPIVYKVIKKETKPKPILITIKAARVNADKGVNEIAESIGITTHTLYSWEKYKNKIPYQDFLEICRLYSTPPENINGYREGNWFVAERRKERLK